jgi:hypothetical protein
VPVVSEDSPDGEYYIDGESARLPRVRKRVGSSTATRSYHTQQTAFTSYSLELAERPEQKPCKSIMISNEHYLEFQRKYEEVCLKAVPKTTDFTNTPLGPKDVLEDLIGLYLDKFDNILPFLHQHTITKWLRQPFLELAMAAIGSQYLGNQLFSASMHEFVLRYLLSLDESLELCWKVNVDSGEVNVVLKWLEWLKIHTSAKGHHSAYIYPVVLYVRDISGSIFIHMKPTFTSFLDFPYTNASLLSLATPCYCLIVSES